MNNKKNIIVMFLLVMLSFAIISEVSAASDAEADGMGLDYSMKVDTHIGSERMGHDLKSQNEQISFNNTQKGNVENKNLSDCDVGENFKELPFNNTHEIDMCKKFDSNESFGFDKSGDNKSFDHLKNNFSNFNEMGMNFTDYKLDNNHTKTIQNNGDALSDVIPNLMGMEKIAPNIKKDDGSAKKNNYNNSPKKSEKHKIIKAKKSPKKSIKIKNKTHKKLKKERIKL